jgi:parvulin-like peptidyl-prolyl isomerase
MADSLNTDDLHAGDLNADDLNTGDLNADDLKQDSLNTDDLHTDDLNTDDLNTGDLNVDDLRKDSLRDRQTHTVRRTYRKPRQYSLPFVAFIGTALLMVGVVLGACLMRLRRQAPQVVAAVNGVLLDRTNFGQRLELAGGPAILRGMIDEELQLQFARKKGIIPDEKEVQARFARAAQQPDFLQRLQANHRSPELYKRQLRIELAKTALLTQGVSVTDAQIQQYYQTQIDRNNPRAIYYSPEAIQIEIIVTAREEEANKALQALNSAVPFADVARRYSRDRSRAQGGQIPPYQRGRTSSSRIPELEAAIFALKVGQQWGPRRFGHTWWIVHCLNKAAERVAPFAQVKDECRMGALIARAVPLNGARITAEYDEFKRHSVIQAFDPRYASVVIPK